jgi:hypothetical protein
MRFKQHIAILLGLVYGIVILHKTLPHHHHLNPLQMVTTICGHFMVYGGHSDYFNLEDHDEFFCTKKEFPNSEKEECVDEFENLFYKIESVALSFLAISNIDYRLPEPEGLRIHRDNNFIRQDLLVGYHLGGPSRAPPII